MTELEAQVPGGRRYKGRRIGWTGWDEAFIVNKFDCLSGKPQAANLDQLEKSLLA